MRKSILAKVLVFSLVSWATCMLCSPIRAQLPRTAPRTPKTTASAALAPPTINAGKFVLTQQEADAFNRKTDLQRPMASSGLNDFTVETVGNQVMVKARAAIYESRPGIYHLWSLRVLSPSREVVVPRHIYRDQPIPSAPGKDLSPEFADTFLLDPGDYLVEISMHKMHLNLALDQQKFEEGGSTLSNQCFAVKKKIRID